MSNADSKPSPEIEQATADAANETSSTTSAEAAEVESAGQAFGGQERPSPQAEAIPAIDPRSDDAVLARAHSDFAQGALSSGIALLIDQATGLAQHHQLERAINLFRLSRASLTKPANAKRVASAVANTQRKLVEEREAFRRRIEERAPGEGRKVVVIDDSLGLPRVEEASLPNAGVPLTYADKIQTWSSSSGAKVPLRVHALCQRYFTTDDVVEQLYAMRMSLRSAYVLLHVGLNDCATRIFSQRERLAVGLLDESTQQKLLDFVRTYRPLIIHRDPEYNYVALPKFSENLEKAVKIARSHGGSHIAFVAIVQPRLAAERHTSHMRWNFTRYNWAIYDAAKRMSVDVIDADRLCWARGLDHALNRDGIHLSPIGHNMMAEAYLELVAPKLSGGKNKGDQSI